MTQAVQQPHSSSEARWWHSSRSLTDIAEHLEHTVKDRQQLEIKLANLLEENEELANRCAQMDAELAETTATLAKLQDKPAGKGRMQAEIAARERLLKDEFERKTQELRLSMNNERREFSDRLERLKKELAGCFCRQRANEFTVHVEKGADPKVVRVPTRRR